MSTKGEQWRALKAKRAAMRRDVEVVGDAEVRNILDNITMYHAQNLLRATVQSIASRIAAEAKKNAPVRTGKLKKSIKAVRRKSPPDRPVSDVTAKGGTSSAYYWRFVEFGTNHARKQGEQPFVRPAIDLYRANKQAWFSELFGKKLEAALKRAAKKRLRTN